MILGAALYACEGTKFRIDNRGGKHYEVDFTNNNPKLISLFLKFLRVSIKAPEDKIKAQLFVYPDHDEDEVLRFWSKTTDIPLNRFNKVIHLTQKSGRFKPAQYGTLKIRYHHKENFITIQGIISQVFKWGGVA